MAPVNPARGEVSLVVDGVPRRLRLTLGALAALEARLKAGSLLALAERFETGAVRAEDLTALLAAGLAGAGDPMDEGALAEAEIEGGAAAAIKAGMALLARSFGASPETGAAA
ncbi:MAG: GTA-gp10 family protein [Pseudomonadota bacterium]